MTTDMETIKKKKSKSRGERDEKENHLIRGGAEDALRVN